MTKNGKVFSLCAGILALTAAFMTFAKQTAPLHAGIGGTWSGASPSLSVTSTESLKDLIRSGDLSADQKEKCNLS